MPNITIRDIPQEIMDKIKTLSTSDRRSLNSEILVLLESGLKYHVSIKSNSGNIGLSKQAQLDLWEGLAGKWDDIKSLDEITHDIYSSRTKGRDVSL